jgi:TonB family protein
LIYASEASSLSLSPPLSLSLRFVGNTGFEPVTPALSRQYSKPTELITRKNKVRKDLKLSKVFYSAKKHLFSSKNHFFMRQSLFILFLTFSLYSIAQKTFQVKVIVRSYDGFPLENITVKSINGTEVIGNKTNAEGFCYLVMSQKSFSVTASDESENYATSTSSISLTKAENCWINIEMVPGAKLNLERLKQDDMLYGNADSIGKKPCSDSNFVEASYPGGNASLMKYIRETIRYPEVSIDRNESGKVYLSFIVETDGKLSHINVERGVSPEIDQEALRIFIKSPKWVPAICNGTMVRSRYKIPINFSLN